MNYSKVLWVLRIAVFGEFLGHGVLLAGQGAMDWLGAKLISVDLATATTIMMIVGALDILIAIIVLLRPIRPVLLWAAIWGFWTALVRPLVGEPIWDFIERFANWGAPLALYLLMAKSNRNSGQ